MRPITLVLVALSIASAADVKLTPRTDSAGRGKRSATDAGDAGQLAAPVVGYWVRQSPLEVRVLLGVPGATHFSEPFALPENAKSIVTPPGQRWLLVLRADGTASAWIPESGLERTLPDLPGNPDLLAFSNDASSLALYSKANARVAVYTGLPTEPQLASNMSTAVWPDDVAAMAITRNGTVVAGLTQSGEALVLAAQGEAMRRLLVDHAGTSAIAFWSGSERLVLLDAEGRRVLAVDHPLQGTAARELAVLEAAMPSPTARIAMGDGASLLVAAGPSGRIVRIEAYAPGEPTGDVRSTQVSVFAEAAALRERGSLVLSGSDGTPRRILVSGAVSSELHYVPALAQPVEAAERERQ